MRAVRFLLVALLLLAGCRAEAPARTETADPATEESAVEEATGHDGTDHAAMGHGAAGASSYTDLRFLDRMMPHHAMAVEMAAAAAEKASSPALRQLAQAMVADQQAEVDTMRAWRARWFPDAPAPAALTPDDLAAMGMAMDMDALGGAAGPAYDRAFLRAMVPHHAGALVMAAEAEARSERPEVQAFARRISAGQAAEIGRMQALLDE